MVEMETTEQTPENMNIPRQSGTHLLHIAIITAR